jgi:polyisoprenyl-teichoic acid--peptidoglycan teichoic acid transferase
LIRARWLWPATLVVLLGVALMLWVKTLSWVYRPVASANPTALASQQVFRGERLDEEALSTRAGQLRSAQVVTPPVASLDLPGQPAAAVSPASAAATVLSVGPTSVAVKSAAPSLRLLIVQTSRDQLDQGAASSVVLLHVDPQTQRARLLTLPPSTQVAAQAPGQAEALGDTYAHGGLPSTLRSVEMLLGRPVEVYVEISQGGLYRLIEGLGSVTLDIPAAVQGAQKTYAPGPHTLSAADALDYVNGQLQSGPASSPDSNGPASISPDGGRGERSQQLMDALVASMSKQNPSALFMALPQLKGQIRTNMTPSELLRWQRQYPFLFTTQRQVLSLNGATTRSGGQALYALSDAERVRLYRTLR